MMSIILEDKVLSYIERRLLEDLAREIAEKMPEAASIILFGSRARGNSDEESDLDIAIILDVDRITFQHWQRLWDIKWDILEARDSEEFPLSMILLRKEELLTRNYGLENELKREGIVIWERN